MMKMITVLFIGALSSFVLSGCIANKNDDSDHKNLTASASKAANSTPAFEAYQQDPNPTTAFNYLFDVATHPRCVNCHGVIEDGAHRPTVGDNSVPHPMNITSLNNLKIAVQEGKFVQVGETHPVNCRGCHQDENAREPGRPPGAANDLMPGFVWHMPPPTMIIGNDMTPSKLCNNWLNPRLNSFLAQRGGRDDMKTFKKEFEHHVGDDPLVRWAWNPGPGRTPAPGTHAQFAKEMSVWINGGAPCPTES